jgi:hypothetical protein
MYWPHIWWLNQAVTRGVDCNERCLYVALIIHCVDCSVAESKFYRIIGSLRSDLNFVRAPQLELVRRARLN